MLTGQPVITFKIEGPRQFKPHPHQLRPGHQDCVESVNGLVQVVGLFRFRCFRKLGSAQGSQTHEKQNIHLFRIIGLIRSKWTENDQGLGESDFLPSGFWPR